ncbi:MAG: 30S ribosomal protein S12 methylthiotransferase RimO [Spirochaetales bacterium]|nr:30S ribosomal protein S12 methylthiotransferase RimO [Spirochaetales bacterium]
MKIKSMSSNSIHRTESSFYIEHLGCAKNQVDAEIMIDTLLADGYRQVKEAGDADFIIVNSCSFIAPAREETVQTALEFRKLYPASKIIMAGCFSQRYAGSMPQIMPEIDGVFGNYDPARIGEVFRMLEKAPKALLVPQQAAQTFKRNANVSFPNSMYVKLSEGCRHRCSFCAIPFIRGNLRSRSIDDVVSEIRQKLKEGCFEFNLIAQDLASFGMEKGEKDFIPLLEKISKLRGKFWIRFLYIHPDNFPLEILDLCRRDKRFLPYFDIPFQHASARILMRMGRRGSAYSYLNLLEKIRAALPDAVIRSTFMVGYPGESESDFQELCTFQEEAKLDWAGVFRYSREEGTAAWNQASFLSRIVTARKAEKRKKIIGDRQEQITNQALRRHVGKDYTVIIEEPVQNELLYLARAGFQAPEVDGLVVVAGEGLEAGQTARVRITGINGIDCKGELLG